MAIRPAALAAALAGLALAACASPRPPAPATAEQSPCRTQPNESSLDIQCGPTTDQQWQEEQLDEAKKTFERNSPQGRVP